MAYAGGIDWVTIQKAIYDWVVACTGLAADHIIWADQNAPRPTHPAIVMKLTPVDDSGRAWIDREVKYLTFADIVVTSVDATANTFTKASHGLLTGDGPVRLVGAALPGGTAEDTDYWVIKVDDNTFKLATGFVNSKNGVAIDLTSAGSGTITLVDTAVTLRAGQEITYKSRSLIRLMLSLECYTGNVLGLDMATSILWRIQARRLLPSKIAYLDDANIGVAEFGSIKAIDGTHDLVLFEPRAFVNVLLHTTSEDSEDGTIIERTDISSLDPAMSFTVDVENEP